MPPHSQHSNYIRNVYKWCAVEIIIDLPISFPINNIISLYKWCTVTRWPADSRPNRTALPQWTLDT